MAAMRIFTITDTITVLRGEKDAEQKYRQAISARIIGQFGKGPYPPEVQKEVFTFCQQYFVEEFEKTCVKETSYTFYREIFTLNEQATDLRRSDHYHQLPNGIDKQYIFIYRRVLKMILEKGCDVDMQRGEKRDPSFIRRIQPVLNDLLYLGEMIIDFTESFAEFSMVEGISQVTFDEHDLYKQVREPYFDHVFDNISKDLERMREDYIIDPSGFADFKAAVQLAFGFDYDKIGLLIAALYDKFKMDPPDCLCADRHNFIIDAANICEASRESVASCFSGLILERSNKMPLVELVRKPYLMNRFLYRPFLEWRINGTPYLICGIYSGDEAENSLILNAIPWGKVPNEWLEAPGIKDYVHRKQKDHDDWLDDQVEKIVTGCGLRYDRGVEKIHTKGKSFSLLEKSVGEIDFLIICPATQKLLVAECKHLLGRYDMVSWKQDYDHFTVDGSKPGYNTRLAAKVVWVTNHLLQVEEHFRIKNSDSTFSLDNFEVEGVFVINTPTFYMYNALYRIYTYHQFEEVITGRYTDPVYTLVHETDDSISTYWVKYPYFAKRELRYFDPGDDDDCEVDKYGFPIKRPDGDASN
jgi:hypothetical protein